MAVITVRALLRAEPPATRRRKGEDARTRGDVSTCGAGSTGRGTSSRAAGGPERKDQAVERDSFTGLSLGQ